MTSPLQALVGAAGAYPTAECFVVSPVTHSALEADVRSMTAAGRAQSEVSMDGWSFGHVMGIPVAKTRHASLRDVPYMEVHFRDPLTLEPIAKRLLP